MRSWLHLLEEWLRTKLRQLMRKYHLVHKWHSYIIDLRAFQTNNSGVFLPKEFHCVLGCNVAVNIYISKLEADLQTPPPPVLVADSLTPTSLQLEWNYEKANLAGLKYLVQWKYEKVSPSWQFYKKQTWAPNDTIFALDDLQPFTKYRVGLLL